MIKLTITHDDGTKISQSEVTTGCPEFDTALIGLFKYGMKYIQEANDEYLSASGHDMSTYDWYTHLYSRIEEALTEADLAYLL